MKLQRVLSVKEVLCPSEETPAKKQRQWPRMTDLLPQHKLLYVIISVYIRIKVQKHQQSQSKA